MGKSIQHLIDELPAARKTKVEAEAARMAADMIAEADTLERMRKAVGKTQVEVAKKLGIGQNAVSQLESRTEIYMSTLRRYVEALGLHLQIALLTKDGERIELPNFHPWGDTPPHAKLAKAEPAVRAAVAAKKTGAKGRKKAVA